MGNSIRVSAISAFYKKGKYLKKFFDEVPHQTYFSNLEIVFDHNEPIDDEISLINQFQKGFPNHLSYFVTNPVVPIGVSWNNCIKKSKGEYLTIWNIDDLRTPFSIERQVEILDKCSHIDIVTGNYTRVQTFPSEKGSYIDITKIKPHEMMKNFHLGPFFMFRKNICKKAGYFDEQFKCANDHDFALRLLSHGKLFIINENLGFFLDENTGLSTKPGSLCPIESTVIHLRYGNYDKVEYRLLPSALRYDIYHIKYGDQWVPVENYIPHYHEMLEEKFDNLFSKGLLLNLKTNARKIIMELIKTSDKVKEY